MKQVKQMKQQAQKGFTLIELMIVVAIIGILAAIALPAFSAYTAKSKYTEAVVAVTGVKKDVELCILDRGNITGCTNSATAGANGNGWALKAGTAYATTVVANIVVTDGVIVMTPNATGGIEVGDTLTLTPVLAGGGQVTWTKACADTSLC